MGCMHRYGSGMSVFDAYIDIINSMYYTMMCYFR